jgi:hypothetical protein
LQESLGSYVFGAGAGIQMAAKALTQLCIMLVKKAAEVLALGQIGAGHKASLAWIDCSVRCSGGAILARAFMR